MKSNNHFKGPNALNVSKAFAPAVLSVYLLFTGCNSNTNPTTPAKIAEENEKVMWDGDFMTGIQTGTTNGSTIKAIFKSSFPDQNTETK